MPERYESQATAKATGGGRQILGIFARMWLDLLGPRRRLLLRCFREWGRDKGLSLPDSKDPLVLRQFIVEQLPAAEALPDLHLDTLANNYVRAARLGAAWMVFWANLLPLAGVAALNLWLWNGIFARNNVPIPLAVLCSFLISLIALPLCTAISLLAGAPTVAGYLRWVHARQRPTI
jgi:hypothetical protein